MRRMRTARRRIDHQFGISVVGRHQHRAALLLHRPVNLSEARVDRLHALDRRLQLARVPHHVGVGKIHHDQIERRVVHRLGHRVGNALGRHFRGQIIRRHLLRRNQDPVLARERPEVAVCAGGYASAPIGVAAVMARIPLVLMEQNTRPGLSNRMLWRFARKICVGFAETASYFSASKVAVTGKPVRFAFNPSPRPQSEGPLQILVLGGSSGAHRLNIGVLEAFKIYGNRVINLAVVHQTGEADEELVRAGYRDLSLKAEAVPFITDIAGALAAADLVIARAGAMAVTEIALAARAAIFVPYPFHKDRQQEHNARVIAKLGGASIIKEVRDQALLTAGEYQGSLTTSSMTCPGARPPARRLLLSCLARAWL